MPSLYWQNQTAGFQQGMGTIGRALMMRPQLAARSALYQAEAQKNAAEVGEVNARTGLYKNQADKTATETSANNFQLEQVKGITSALLKSGAMTIDPKTGVTTLSPEAGSALFSAAVGSSKGGDDMALASGNILKALNAVPEAGLERQNKSSIAAASDAERAARPVVAGNGSTVFDPDGTPIGEAATTLSPGQNRFAAKGLGDLFGNIQLNQNAQPEATGQPLPAKSSAVQAARRRFVGQVLNNEKLDTPEKRRVAIETYDNQTHSQPSSIVAAIQPALTAPVASAPGQPVPAPQIPPEHIAALLQNPDKASDFDQFYGQGAAARILSQQTK